MKKNTSQRSREGANDETKKQSPNEKKKYARTDHDPPFIVRKHIIVTLYSSENSEAEKNYTESIGNE